MHRTLPHSNFTNYTHADTLRIMIVEGLYVFALVALPGFLMSYVTPDLMHAGDLGVLQVLLGNVLYELFKAMGGTYESPNGSLSNLMNMIRAASKKIDIECPIAALSINMIRVMGGRPKLKTKAAESRHMLKVVAYILLISKVPF